MIDPLGFDVSRLVTPLETSQSLYTICTSDVVHSVISLLVFSRIRCTTVPKYCTPTPKVQVLACTAILMLV